MAEKVAQADGPPTLTDSQMGAYNAHTMKQLGLRKKSRSSLGVVDYTLAKRALLRSARRGMLSTFEICDAHPELMRAAKHVGEPASRPCPVCEKSKLCLLAYVFADDLKQDSGRVWGLQKALKMTASYSGATCYVVEVCTGCQWNFLTEAFQARSAV